MWLLFSGALLIVAILSFLGPIESPRNYHQFADQRNWLQIPNTLNVLSNAVFAMAGIWGISVLFSRERPQFRDRRERMFWIGVFLGFILTALGSTYYHLSPDNFRLIWDRLPMTLVFMSLAAALIGERISTRLGLLLWPIFVLIGMTSVFAWYESELKGSSDIRFYVGIQAFTILTILVLLLMPSQSNQNRDLVMVMMLYGLALFFDFSDHWTFQATGGIVSGHTLKHLVAGLAGIWLIRMIYRK